MELGGWERDWDREEPIVSGRLVFAGIVRPELFIITVAWILKDSLVCLCDQAGSR